MIPRHELLSPAIYTRSIKPYIPAEAFKPAPYKLWQMCIHLLIVVGGYALINQVHYGWWALCVLIMGHSLACIAFLAHELSHNTIVRQPSTRYVLELLFWSINVIPPTLWKRVHNHTHHTHSSTPTDPDRAFFDTERSIETTVYTKLFYPNSQNPRWNLLVGFHLVPYILRNLIAVFYPGDRKPAVVPYKPSFTNRQRIQIVGELVLILVVQAAIFYAVGCKWLSYLAVGPVSYLIASTIIMFYVFTNHFLNPICESTDPLVGTTSVIVPKILNRLHNNFSFHTEHHLFPAANSDYYSNVSEELKKQYSDRYNQLPAHEAWRRLWDSDGFIRKIKS